jgi:hypothetical protein
MMQHLRSTSGLLPAAILLAILLAPGLVLAQQPNSPEQAGAFRQLLDEATHDIHPMHDIYAAMVRLPLAAVFGTALALRPRRRGTPPRDQAVIQTQIVLAVVGALIMLVVGASLARAFGIVGAASLIRYRSKIEDPKDAVVMLASLALGLASGVGLYALTVFSTFFVVALLWVIESFEAQSTKHFSITVKLGADTDALRPRVEAVLKQFNLAFELRTSSDEALCYDVQVPLELQTDRVSDAILRLDPEGHAAVDWSDKKNKTK